MSQQAERRVITLTALGYGLVLALALGLSAVMVGSMNRLAGIADDLYDHPFRVSNAAIGAQAMVALIRDQMLELALSPTHERLTVARTRTQAMDAGLRDRLQTVRQQFLGDPAKVEEIIRQLDDWQRFRESVFELVSDGQAARAAELIETDGAGQFNRAYTSVDSVVKFAQNRAARFRREALVESDRLLNWSLGLLALLAVSVGLIGWAAGRRTVTVLRQEKALALALAESERRFLNAMENAPIGMALMTPDGTLQRVNTAFLKLLGSPAEALLERSFVDLTDPDDRLNHEQRFATLARSGGEPYQLELRYRRRDGSVIWTQTNCSAARNDQGVTDQIVAQVEDISARKAATERDQYLASVVENVFDGILTMDECGIVDSFNQAAERIFGYSRNEMLGRSVNMLMPESHGSRHDGYLRHYLETGEKKIIGIGRTVQGRRKDGSLFPMDLAVTEIRLGQKLRFTGIVRDITERVRAEEEVRRMAHHDTLTGLPNRTLLQDRLQHALARAQREQTRLALLFLDLDRFKKINDTLGHDVGDELLIATTQRLLACVRESDTVARMGGDEFIVILPDIGFPRDAECVAQKILAAMAEPVRLAGSLLNVSTSIGIAIYPDHGTHQTELFRSADMAMYQAKNAGRATYQTYSENGPAWRYSAAPVIRKVD